MFKKLLFRLLGKSKQRVEAEEAYEKEFGRQPPRSFSTSFINQMVETRQRPQAVRRVNSGHGVRSAQNDLNNPLHPAHPLNPANMEAFANSRSHFSCGSSDSGSSSSGSCD